MNNKKPEDKLLNAFHEEMKEIVEKIEYLKISYIEQFNKTENAFDKEIEVFRSEIDLEKIKEKRQATKEMFNSFLKRNATTEPMKNIC